MFPKVYIRNAISSDISTIVEYNLALAKETENRQISEEVLKLGIVNALKRNDCHYFVAEVKGKVIGQTMITNEWSDWKNGVIWWLQSVYVTPEYRKKSVFKRIFQYVETLGKRDPLVKGLRLYVMKNNQLAQVVYRKLGIDDSSYIVYDKDVNVGL